MMARTQLRWLGLEVVLAAGLAQPAAGAVRGDPAGPPVVTAGRPARLVRDVRWQRGGADLAGWTAMIDRDTGVPLRIWGPGHAAPGAMASPAVAEAWARAFLAAHLELLSPGAAAGDFVVVANQLSPSGEVRSVGFAQRAAGVAVLGGSVSFAFKHDRMILVGSTALPHVTIAPEAQRAARLAPSRVARAAIGWLGQAGHRVAVRAGGPTDQLIVPIVHPRGRTGPDITYTLAEQIAVESIAGTPGRWNVFVDARTGAPFARESTLSFASGEVQFDVWDRAPRAAAGRRPQPAGNAIHTVNGAPVTAGPDGMVTWDGADPARVSPGLTGPLVRIVNQAGPVVTGSLELPAAGTCTWSRPDDEQVDAQLDAFVYASQVKQFARARLDPGLAYLDQQLAVHVNEAGRCNAYSTGDDIHFFPRSEGTCENTGRMADVVYHEFGHSLHRHAIIPGVGQWSGALSEGIADTLATAIVNDSGVGRGFFLDNTPLRELDPAHDKVWPRDATGDVHDDGEIYGQTMWDLRQKLEARLGSAAGFAQFLEIYYGTVQRAVDIPSSFPEALVADDDDGDLANGTPHDCDIIDAFAAHGLFDASITGGVVPPVRDGFAIVVDAPAPELATCHAPTVVSGSVAWRLRDGPLAELPLVDDGGRLRAVIPTQPDGSVVEYGVQLTLSSGTVQRFPDNPADPFYQFAVGEGTPIWCAGFETGDEGWTYATMPASGERWEVGAPAGLGGDPRAAFRGTSVLGTALGGNGRYASVMTSVASSPRVDLGSHVNVHLQYRRWLGVEDGFYDRATILANDVEVWRNFASADEPYLTETNHVDREWRFQDLDLSRLTAGGSIRLRFGLTSDAGLELGGWNLDDVCLVAFPRVCGNHLRESGEACDDGNASDGDGCSSSCERELPPELAEAGGCSAGSGPAAPVGLAAVVLGVLRRRRRDQRLPSFR